MSKVRLFLLILAVAFALAGDQIAAIGANAATPSGFPGAENTKMGCVSRDCGTAGPRCRWHRHFIGPTPGGTLRDYWDSGEAMTGVSDLCDLSGPIPRRFDGGLKARVERPC